MMYRRTYWIFIITLLLVTQVSAASRYLSVDNVNLAFALEYFDPLNHQPQPPGYPLFVLFARGVNYLLGSVEYTFLLVSVLASGLSLLVLSSLGKRLFSEWSSKAAVLLLLVNPVFWQTGLTSPLRPFLALFSLLAAYCAWRCWNGEARYALWGALSIGVGSGFRPELLPILFPIWLVSTWAGTRSLKTVALGTSVLAGCVAIWVGALVVAVGGVGALLKLLGDYLVIQAGGESPLMGADLRAFLRQAGRIGTWNLTAVLWWIWALPLLFRSGRRVLETRTAAFVALWILPGLVLQVLVHGAAPGHTMFSIPALCLVGAHVVDLVGQRFSTTSDSFQLRETWVSGALVLSVMLFLNFFPTPSPRPETSSRPSLKNAIAFSLNETSLGSVRSMDNVAFATLEEMRQFTPTGRPSIVITTDLARTTWFLNWRILRYYEGTRQIWALNEHTSPRTALRVLRYASLENVTGDPVPISVPKGGRILWVVEPSGTFEAELREATSFFGGRYVQYTDLPADAGPFTVCGFEFRPE